MAAESSKGQAAIPLWKRVSLALKGSSAPAPLPTESRVCAQLSCTHRDTYRLVLPSPLTGTSKTIQEAYVAICNVGRAATLEVCAQGDFKLSEHVGGALQGQGSPVKPPLETSPQEQDDVVVVRVTKSSTPSVLMKPGVLHRRSSKRWVPATFKAVADSLAHLRQYCVPQVTSNHWVAPRLSAPLKPTHTLEVDENDFIEFKEGAELDKAASYVLPFVSNLVTDSSASGTLTARIWLGVQDDGNIVGCKRVSTRMDKPYNQRWSSTASELLRGAGKVQRNAPRHPRPAWPTVADMCAFVCVHVRACVLCDCLCGPHCAQALRDAFPFVRADVAVHTHPVPWERVGRTVFTLPLSDTDEQWNLFDEMLCHLGTAGVMRDRRGKLYVVFDTHVRSLLLEIGGYPVLDTATQHTWEELVTGQGWTPLRRFVYELVINLNERALPNGTLFFRGEALRAPCLRIPEGTIPVAGDVLKWVDMDMVALQQRFADGVSTPATRLAAACRPCGRLRVLLVPQAIHDTVDRSWGDVVGTFLASGTFDRLPREGLQDTINRPLTPVQVIAVCHSVDHFAGCMLALTEVLHLIKYHRPFAADATVVLAAPAAVGSNRVLQRELVKLFKLASSRAASATLDSLRGGAAQQDDGPLCRLLHTFQPVLFRQRDQVEVFTALGEPVVALPVAALPVVASAAQLKAPALRGRVQQFLRGAAAYVDDAADHVPERDIVEPLTHCLLESLRRRGWCTLVPMHQLFGMSGASTVLVHVARRLAKKGVLVKRIRMRQLREQITAHDGLVNEIAHSVRPFAIIVEDDVGKISTWPTLHNACRRLQGAINSRIRLGDVRCVILFCATLQPTAEWPRNSHALPLGLSESEFEGVKRVWQHVSPDDTPLPVFNNPWPMWLFPLHHQQHLIGIAEYAAKSRGRLVGAMKALLESVRKLIPEGWDLVRNTLHALCCHALFSNDGKKLTVTVPSVDPNLASELSSQLTSFVSVVVRKGLATWRLRHSAYAMLLLEALHGKLWQLSSSLAWRLQHKKSRQAGVE